MTVYTQQIKQAEAGLEITHMRDGEPDTCANCNNFSGCQGCPDKPKAEAAGATEEWPSLSDGIDWEI